MAKPDRVKPFGCGDVESFTQSYVDGELAGRDRDTFERHLSECEPCRGAARLAGRMKAAVRGHLPRRPVPSVFEQRIRVALAAQPSAPPRWPLWTWPRMLPAMAAMGLVVAIAVRVRHSPSTVLEQARQTYQAELPLDISGADCGSVSSWFRGRVAFPVHPPRLPAQITCQGGRLVNVEAQPAAYLVYQDPRGHRVSVLMFDAESSSIEAPHRRVVDGREIFYRGGPGISTAAYQDRGLGYVITADLDEDSLTNLVSASFQQNAVVPSTVPQQQQLH
jgi:anti-sigma factor RsiW